MECSRSALAMEHIACYSLFIQTTYLSCTTSEMEQVISRESPILTYPPVFSIPIGGVPVGILP